MASRIPENYLNKLYGGWLGKTIGVRHGIFTEGWTYARIQQAFGEITHYAYNYKTDYTADDDLNGPIFMMRALEDYECSADIRAEHMGLTVLNYAPDGKGFYWWGGKRIDFYDRLKAGIMPPESGSGNSNSVIGQIFVDCWAFVNPGNPSAAVEMAKKAISVHSDGEAMYGGMFITACLSQAFIENDIERIIECGLSYIPENSAYAQMVRNMIHFYHQHPDDWRKAYDYLIKNYGEGFKWLTIIPNGAIVVLSLLYGGGDFAKSINIACMCGWDADCNAGNVGAILGVLLGAEGIDRSWKDPVKDFIATSSTIGCLNAWDIPTLTSYTAKLAYQLAKECYPAGWEEILDSDDLLFHFEYPGSTHSFRGDTDYPGAYNYVYVENTDECAHSGRRCLKVVQPKSKVGISTRAYYRTYTVPDDLFSDKYEPEFSPKVYPGQSVVAWVMVPESIGEDISACIYIEERNSGNIIRGSRILLKNGEWTKLEYTIPYMENAVVRKVGVEFTILTDNYREENPWECTFVGYIDDMRIFGKADYRIDFEKEQVEKWPNREVVGQMTYHRGIWVLEDGYLKGVNDGETAECYTGNIYWKDYEFEAVLIPVSGQNHNINFRVQGAVRAYSVGLASDDRLVLYKNQNGYKKLVETKFTWYFNFPYRIKIRVVGNIIKVFYHDQLVLEYTDEDQPYLYGMVGFVNMNGSCTKYESYRVREL